MEIKDWPINDVNDLANVYNTQTVSLVPHCYEITPEEFGSGRYHKTSDDFSSTFNSERVIVAIQGRKILGFAHVRVGEIEHHNRSIFRTASLLMDWASLNASEGRDGVVIC